MWPVVQHLKDVSPAHPIKTPSEPEQARALWRPQKSMDWILFLLQSDIKTLRVTKLDYGVASFWCIHNQLIDIVNEQLVEKKTEFPSSNVVSKRYIYITKMDFSYHLYCAWQGNSVATDQLPKDPLGVCNAAWVTGFEEIIHDFSLMVPSEYIRIR